MATVYDKSSLFLAPSGVSNGTVFVQKPVPIYGPELVTNGDFSQEGAEIADNNTISNAGGSIITKTSALNYNATSDGTGGSSIRPKLAFDGATSGKSYVIRITPTNQSGLIEFKLYDGSSYIIDNNNLSTYLEFYFKYDGASSFLAFDGTNAFNVDFEISLKEVGQDWTLTVPEITIGESEVNFNSVANASSIRQYDALTVGKIYKATYTISNYSLGGAKIRIGGVQGTQRRANGTYTEYITATLDTSVRVYAVSTTSLSITNISVQEVLSPAGDFTFTRGSNLSATRVNEAQLIEKGRENVLLQSNSFDTTWGKSNTSVTGGQSGYDGSSDAWKIESISDGLNRRLFQSLSSSGVQTYSVYAKAGSADFILLQAVGAAGQFFNLSTGTKGNTYGGVPIESKIELVGNGWYRCSITFSGSITQVWIAQSNGTTTTLEGDNILIQDAQLEIGLAATSVITTGAGTVQAGLLENTPRLDYSGGSTCPSLLLEPSRANLITQSEYYNTAWSLTSASVTDNAVTSPEGVQNASKLIPANGTGGNRSISKLYESLTGLHTFSVFAKAGEYGYISLRARNGPGSFAMFDLTNGLVHATNTNAQMVSGSPKIEDYGNGWYRCSIVFDPSGSATPDQLFLSYSAGITGDETTAFSGDGTSGIYIWGSVFEAGSYPTSYIPTYVTTQTRAGELCNSAGDAATFNSTEGVLYVEIKALENGSIYKLLEINNGGTTDRVYIAYRNNLLYVGIIVGGIVQFGFSTTLTVTDFNKVALKYAENDFALWVNGVEVATDTSGITSAAGTLNSIDFSNSTNGIPFYGKIKELIAFPTALSDLQLAILTGATTYATFGEMALALNYTVYE